MSKYSVTHPIPGGPKLKDGTGKESIQLGRDAASQDTEGLGPTTAEN